MDWIGKKSLSLILRIFTDFCILACIGVLVGLPWLAEIMVDQLTEQFGWSEPYWFIIAFFYICGVLALCILVQGHLILRTLEKNKPFDERNAKRFFRVGLFCLIIAIAFTVKVFMYNTLLTVAGAGIFAIAGLISFILSDVFGKAAQIWEEQQLTI
jgi:MFS family permease